MRTLTVIWIALAGVIGLKVTILIAAAAGILFLVNAYPRKALR